MVSKEQALRAMSRALLLADRARSAGDVPVGAVVLDGKGDIIAQGWNQRETLHDPCAHAEILALRQAGTVLKRWNLADCTMVVTLEPCTMCAGAISAARIDTCVFAAWDPKAGAAGSLRDVFRDSRMNHQVKVWGGVLEDQAKAQLQAFFEQQRADPGSSQRALSAQPLGPAHSSQDAQKVQKTQAPRVLQSAPMPANPNPVGHVAAPMVADHVPATDSAQQLPGVTQSGVREPAHLSFEPEATRPPTKPNTGHQQPRRQETASLSAPVPMSQPRPWERSHPARVFDGQPSRPRSWERGASRSSFTGPSLHSLPPASSADASVSASNASAQPAQTSIRATKPTQTGTVKADSAALEAQPATLKTKPEKASSRILDRNAQVQPYRSKHASPVVAAVSEQTEPVIAGSAALTVNSSAEDIDALISERVASLPRVRVRQRHVDFVRPPLI